MVKLYSVMFYYDKKNSVIFYCNMIFYSFVIKTYSILQKIFLVCITHLCIQSWRFNEHANFVIW